MFTFIVMVAVAAFIPYVAVPGIEKGVKAVAPQPAAFRFDAAPDSACDGSDAANRIVINRRDSGTAA
ncbi:MAG TPA: hypothetical protein VFE79_11565 [Paraburkholderia sp.]|jgi:hypothetical protein|nr:hypothetical protein [Paraburkholderia sp.]